MAEVVATLENLNESEEVLSIRDKRGTGAKMPLAVVSGVVTREAPVTYWPIFSLSLVTVQTSLRKLTWPSFFFSTTEERARADLKTELTSRKTANFAPKARIRSFPRAFLLCVNFALSWLNLPIYPPERNTKAVVESCSFSRAATVYGGS